MTPLSSLLRELYGAAPRRGRDPGASAPAVVGLGEVATTVDLGTALRAAVDVAREGNGAVVLTAKSREEIAMGVLRFEASRALHEDGGGGADCDVDLRAAAARAVVFPLWIDEITATPVLIKRLRRLAADFDTYTREGDRLRRLALVVIDSSGDDASRVADEITAGGFAVLVC
jgi:hypothetical protein